MVAARTTIGIIGLVLLGARCATPTLDQPADASSSARKHVTVRFTDMALRPETARVQRDGRVIWINDSTTYLGAVYFDESIRDEFTCEELRPLFYKVAGGYQSLTLQGATESVGLPCPLKPGSHRYELRLFRSFPGQPAAAANPDARMPGTIVVE